MNELNDKVALVTGAASGLGEATIRRFAAAGAKVVAADIRPFDPGVPEILPVTLDVVDPEGWEKVLDTVIERFGRIDVLLNAAGVAFDGDTVESCTPEIWNRTISVNLDGTFLGCQHVSQHMAKAGTGSIINVSSVNGASGDGGIVAEGVAAYGASKAGVRMLTRSAARHLAEQKTGVRCNAILPGYFATPMVTEYIADHAAPADARGRIEAAQPLGRLGWPPEFASIALYLASDRAQAVTGSEYVVDGGYLAR